VYLILWLELRLVGESSSIECSEEGIKGKKLAEDGVERGRRNLLFLAGPF
jgi:hypothetical protein